jgi:hypothetical protein
MGKYFIVSPENGSYISVNEDNYRKFAQSGFRPMTVIYHETEAIRINRGECASPKWNSIVNLPREIYIAQHFEWPGMFGE